MLAGNAHRIGRQILELALPEVATAARLQEQAAQRFRDRPPEAMERLFDRVAGPGDLMLIERLEVDLGTVAGPDWADQLTSRLERELETALVEARAEGAARLHRVPAAVTQADDFEPGLEVVGEAEIVFEQYVFFLERGRLPWWGGRPHASWQSLLPPWPTAPQLSRLRAVLLGGEAVRRRCAATAPSELLAFAVEVWAGLPDAAGVVEQLLSAREDSRASARCVALWSILLGRAVGGGPVTAAAEVGLVGRMLAVVLPVAAGAGDPVSPFDPTQAATRGGTEAPRIPELPDPWREWSRLALEPEPGPAVATPEAACRAAGLDAADDSRSARQASEPIESPKPREASPLPATPTAGKAGEPGTEPSATADHQQPFEDGPGGGRAEAGELHEATRSQPEPPLRTGEAVAVDGAGAVILHPFLEELFGGRGLLADREFRNEDCRCRAVHLLTHLTFGDVEVEEYDQLLIKLLCAMPWEDPVAPMELGAEDLQSCADLLNAVIGHWQALKSSSADWVRQQFLLRSGSLEAVDHGWKLTVEGQAQDLLLGRLPWGIGMIRLPWMTQQLHVNWAD